jgi:excisionase family DNA binding protein
MKNFRKSGDRTNAVWAISRLRKIGGFPAVLKRLPKKQAVYTAAEAAHAFGVTIRTVYTWFSEGKLDHVRAGGRTIRIPHGAVVRMLEGLMADHPEAMAQKKRPRKRPNIKRSQAGEYPSRHRKSRT